MMIIYIFPSLWNLVFVINDVEERMAFAKCRGCRLHSMTGEEIVKEGNRTTTTTTTEKKKERYKVLSLFELSFLNN
jgi:hypothetical protein